MRNVILFAEDSGHQVFVQALVERYAREYGIALAFEAFSATGGHGRAISELERFIRDLRKGRAALPDLLIVAIDANCSAFREMTRRIREKISDELWPFVVLAVPDPHVERWLLLDSSAFRDVFGKGCAAPDAKCERGRYKRLLLEAVRDAGTTPLAGGLEFAPDLVAAMDLNRMERTDESLGGLIAELRSRFSRWRRQ